MEIYTIITDIWSIILLTNMKLIFIYFQNFEGLYKLKEYSIIFIKNIFFTIFSILVIKFFNLLFIAFSITIINIIQNILIVWSTVILDQNYFRI